MTRVARIAIPGIGGLLAGLLFLSLQGEDGKVGWKKQLKDRSQRGTLEDIFQRVRGDSGRWRDEFALQVSPPPAGPGKNLSLDAWADNLAEKSFLLLSSKDTWLIHRTEQLDDNDRTWIESIERKGNEISVTWVRATWEGYYSKNFTWYGVTGVNLGKLPAGQYTVKWIEKPLVYRQFEDPKQRRTSWPRDEGPPADEPGPRKTTLSFRVGDH